MASHSLSRAEAKSLVNKIAKDHGYLGEALYARMDDDMRREVQEALLAKDKIIGASVMLLARELYSKDVRFIFELLQNADDNHYTKTRSPPFVAFHLRRKTLVVECNEDGFDEKNLRAICNIGNSSKTQGHGYIGEKGIGFKSVFKVASKVHIQSGPFSFAFMHRQGDSGMGMISPEWMDSAGGQIPSQMTRITLYLSDDADSETRHESIKKQLNELESNMLLFLKNIKRIEVHVYDEDDEETSSNVMTVSLDEGTHRAVLTKRRTEAGATEETKTYCHVTKHQTTNLSKSDHRTYTRAEEEAKSYHRAEVILAFPLTEDSTPIIEAQQVFAFLPLRHLGFNFLIQADFVTMANREDIVTSSRRNLGLLAGISEAFIEAVHQMYQHGQLRYTWMRYLRNIRSYPWDRFWKTLVESIESKVRASEVLQPRREGPPRSIQSLSRLGPQHLQRDGKPLFADLPGSSEKYISTGYESSDLDILSEYSLSYMNQSDVIDRLIYDLEISESRMKDPSTSNDWHTRAAKLINTCFEQQWDSDIQELNLIPLSDGRWVSAAQTVYFPQVHGNIAIPGDLRLALIQPLACENPDRAKLFKNLGAKTASVTSVRRLILRQYSRQVSIPLGVSRSHLSFLYQTHKDGTPGEYEVVRLWDTKDDFVSLSETDIYFVTEQPNSLWQIFRRSGDDWMRTRISFLNPEYLRDPPKNANGMLWDSWLFHMGVRMHPRLVGHDGASLSPLCHHVAKNLPSEFLNFLQWTWEFTCGKPMLSEDSIDELEVLRVRCQGLKELQPLSSTYLPLPRLKECCQELMQEDPFPFLDLGEPWSSEQNEKWGFLRDDLAVGADESLQFYIDMLKWMMEAGSLEQEEKPWRVVRVYLRIQSRCEEDRDPEGAKSDVRIDLVDLIFLPRYKDEEGLWTTIKSCVLKSPQDLKSSHPIMSRYEAVFPGADLVVLEKFFRQTLRIRECSWTDIVEDLALLKEGENSDFDRIRSRYELLNQLRAEWITTSLTTDQLRQRFESESLIFIQNEQGQYLWTKPSKCLWSSATELQHRFSLNSYYDEDLEDFFVTVLGVSRLTFDMVYDELYGINATSTVQQVKNYLWEMNAFLETETTSRSVQNLIEKRIFPVNYASGGTKLVASGTQFAIVDREPLRLLFQDKINLLDFRLDEVHRLEPLLHWMGLKDRYLSCLVKERTVVDTESTHPLTDRTLSISRRSHALTRVAVHFRSPRTRTADLERRFHDLLLHTETWETESISSELSIHQNDALVTVDSAQTEVHITSSENPLKIFVPRDETLQEVCFNSALPRQLVRWMATDPITQQVVGEISESAIKTVTSILGTRSVVAMGQILDQQGVVNIDIPAPSGAREDTTQAANTPVIPGIVAEENSEQESDSPRPLDRFYTPASDTSEADRYYGSEDDRDVFLRPQGSAYARQTLGRALTPSPSTPATQNSRLYPALLQHVVECARTSLLPHLGAVSMSTSPDRYQRYFPSASERLLQECGAPLLRDFKIGALGELFAFEMLRTRLGGGFGRDCWQSTIRKEAAGQTGHPDYVDMEPWNGGGQPETSDIVYTDADGLLTGLLVAGGHLRADPWSRRQGVLYYIEVKSTFGSCETAFYVSDRQKELMRELMTDQAVYMIIRVFNMNSGDIGAKIYVDPATMEREGTLIFATEKWTVTPGHV